MDLDITKIIDAIKNAIISEIRDELKEFKASVTGELSGFRLAIQSISERQTSIEANIHNLKSELKQEIQQVRSELKQEIQQVRSELKQEIQEVRSELKQEIQLNTLRIDETNKRIDETNKRIDILTIETNKKIDLLNQRIDDTNKRIDELTKEVYGIKNQLTESISYKRIIEDTILRIQKLETAIFKN